MVTTKRLSPEAPIPVADLTTKYPQETPGGAGFGAAFGSKIFENVILASAYSSKSISKILRFKICPVYLANVSSNITKTRIIDKNSNYQMLRIDSDAVTDVPDVSLSEIIDKLENITSKVSDTVFLVADYQKNLFKSDKNWHSLLNYLSERGIIVLLDTKTKNIRQWLPVTKKNIWIKLNLLEATRAVNVLSLKTIEEMSDKYIPQLLVTKGDQGADLYYNKNKITRTSDIQEHLLMPDVSGCGDIFDVMFLNQYLSIIKDVPSNKISIKLLDKCLKNTVNTASKYAHVPFKDKLL